MNKAEDKLIKPDPKRPYVPVKEACGLLPCPVSESTMRKYKSMGWVRWIKQGGILLIEVDSLNDLIKRED